MAPRQAALHEVDQAAGRATTARAQRFSVQRTPAGTYEVHDARGALRVVLQGADAHDADAARHYAKRLNEMSDVELVKVAGVCATNVNAIDTAADGLPTVAGYRQLYLLALEQLQEREPTWSRDRRERVARGMAEAYCQGAIGRARRDAVAAGRWAREKAV